jgi:poly-gamma-glutamate synthesis protein (capsule biosynthesis protein)
MSMMRAPLIVFALLLSLPQFAAAQAPRSLSLTFIGDIMAHDVNFRMRDYHDIYRDVEQTFLADDLTVANLELPVDPTRPESGYPYFNGNGAYLRAAADSGVDVLSAANNHAFDGGAEGIFQTLRSFHSLRVSLGRPIAFSGIRGNPHGSFYPDALTVRGVRVGFVAATQFLNESDAGRYVQVVDYSDETATREFLDFVSRISTQFDVLIVSYHGDREYSTQTSSLKRRFFHRLLEAGACIVFSHHPHVVQGYEIVRVRGADRLIMYSMGNFISGMTWRLDPGTPSDVLAATGEAYMLCVQVRCAGGCTVTSAEPVPIANYKNERGEMVVARMEDLAKGAMALPAIWKTFYAERLLRMRRFLAGFAK